MTPPAGEVIQPGVPTGGLMPPSAGEVDRPTVAVCVVARDEAEHIVRVVRALAPLVGEGTVDEVVVIDGGSIDDTAALAEAEGTRVVRAGELRTDLGAVLGKGDTLWRGASVLRQDVLVVIDADIYGDLAQMVRRLAGPLVHPEGSARFVKGHFRRVASLEQLERPDPATYLTGGRVTELVARPLIQAVAPQLMWCREPLSGQIAIEREVLANLGIVTGYGLEIGMLFDVVAAFGAGAVEEVDLGVIYNPPQPDVGLEKMAKDVMATLLSRVERAGGLRLPSDAHSSLWDEVPIERTPFGAPPPAPTLEPV